MNWHESTTTAAPPRQRMSKSFGESVHELVSLLELQAELLKIDARESAARIVTPGIWLAVAAVIGLATVPIALLLLVELLIEAGLWASIALLIVTIIGFGTAAGLAIAAFARLRSSLNVFARSRDEWRRTVQSIKEMLQSTRDDRPEFSDSRYAQ